MIYTAAQYTLAMSIELERRSVIGSNNTDLSSLSDDIKKRALELSAYFTIPALDPAHTTLALFSAMNFAHKNKQYSSALGFANRLIREGTNAKFVESVSEVDPSYYAGILYPANLSTNSPAPQAKKIKAVCERNPTDAIEIEFDQHAEFDVCAASYTPIYHGDPSAASPFCGVKYHAKYKGTVCRIDQVTQIGASVSGLKLCM